MDSQVVLADQINIDDFEFFDSLSIEQLLKTEPDPLFLDHLMNENEPLMSFDNGEQNVWLDESNNETPVEIKLEYVAEPCEQSNVVDFPSWTPASVNNTFEMDASNINVGQADSSTTDLPVPTNIPLGVDGSIVPGDAPRSQVQAELDEILRSLSDQTPQTGIPGKFVSTVSE